MDIGTLLLADFGGGELLAIVIPTLAPLVFLLSLSCPCLCYDEIKSEHAHNRHTGGGVKREKRKTRGTSVGIAIAKSSPPPKAANIKAPIAKVSQHHPKIIPKSTCQSHISTPTPQKPPDSAFSLNYSERRVSSSAFQHAF